VLVVSGTVWEPECLLIRELVKFEEERHHHLKMAEEGAAVPRRCSFRGVVESEFLRAESVERYYGINN
jgi:hypothetical protein